jgi:hypothetical protein
MNLLIACESIRCSCNLLVYSAFKETENNLTSNHCSPSESNHYEKLKRKPLEACSWWLTVSQVGINFRKLGWIDSEYLRRINWPYPIWSTTKFSWFHRLSAPWCRQLHSIHHIQSWFKQMDVTIYQLNVNEIHHIIVFLFR